MRIARMHLSRSMAILSSLMLALAAPGTAAAEQVLPQAAPDDAPGEAVASPRPNPAKARPPASAAGAFSPALTPPNIGGGTWLAEGPGPAIFGQVEAIVPGPDEVVGAVHTVAAHPTDVDILFAGGANGGIWKTTDAISTSPFWTPLTDAETSLSIGALEFDPTDGMNDTLVAGIGRYSSFGSSGGTRTGLLRTTDAGATWTAIDGTGAIAGSNISGVAPRGATIVATANTADLVGGFLLCSDVGIFRSTDTGASFPQVVAPSGPVGVAFDLASDPASSSTLYSGLTFVPTCTAGALTNGIYKSTDTGLTWTKVSTPAVDAFIIDGTTNNIEIAVDGLDVYTNIIQSGRPAAIFHSPDGGTTWTAMDVPRTPEGMPVPIMLPDVLVPGTPIIIDHLPSGFMHGLTTSNEVEVTGVLGTVGANGVWPVTVLSPFAFSLDGSGDAAPWTPGTGAWTKVVGLNPKATKAGSQGGIHAAIRVDPTTSTTVYIGGDRQDSPFPNFLGAMDFSGRLFRGDATVAPTGAIPSPQWQHLTHLIGPPTAGGGTLSGSAPHADSREMVFDANGDLIEGDDGGIYVRTSPSTNGGDWFSLNGNLQVTEQHDVAYDAISNVIISGNQDTGTTQQQMPGGNLTWDSVSTADGGDVAVDDFSAMLVSTRYSSFQNLGAFRRRDYDASNGLLSEVFPTLIPAGALTLMTNFVTPVELNPLAPGALIIGGCNAVFESFDKGDTITEIPGLADADCSPAIMAFAQNAMVYGGFSGGFPDPDAIWVGSGASVYRRLAPPGMPLVVTPSPFPGGTVTDIVLDPTDTSTAYVTDATDVYMTHDAGTTWTTITANLTDTRIGSAVIDPAGSRLFVGGREGVSVIALPTPGVPPAGPIFWGQIGTGLPNAPVWDMEWDAAAGKLIVGTLGRGAWTLQEDGTCGFPKKLKVRNEMVSAATTFKACNEIFGGPLLTVEPAGPAAVDFIAGVKIAFGNGTVFGGAGAVRVEIDASLISP